MSRTVICIKIYILKVRNPNELRCFLCGEKKDTIRCTLCKEYCCPKHILPKDHYCEKLRKIEYCPKIVPNEKSKTSQKERSILKSKTDLNINKNIQKNQYKSYTKLKILITLFSTYKKIEKWSQKEIESRYSRRSCRNLLSHEMIGAIIVRAEIQAFA